jgi:hypothetical protein
MARKSPLQMQTNQLTNIGQLEKVFFVGAQFAPERIKIKHQTMFIKEKDADGLVEWQSTCL